MSRLVAIMEAHVRLIEQKINRLGYQLVRLKTLIGLLKDEEKKNDKEN